MEILFLLLDFLFNFLKDVFNIDINSFSGSNGNCNGSGSISNCNGNGISKGLIIKSKNIDLDLINREKNTGSNSNSDLGVNYGSDLDLNSNGNTNKNLNYNFLDLLNLYQKLGLGIYYNPGGSGKNLLDIINASQNLDLHPNYNSGVSEKSLNMTSFWKELEEKNVFGLKTSSIVIDLKKQYSLLDSNKELYDKLLNESSTELAEKFAKCDSLNESLSKLKIEVLRLEKAKSNLNFLKSNWYQYLKDPQLEDIAKKTDDINLQLEYWYTRKNNLERDLNKNIMLIKKFESAFDLKLNVIKLDREKLLLELEALELKALELEAIERNYTFWNNRGKHFGTFVNDIFSWRRYENKNVEKKYKEEI